MPAARAIVGRIPRPQRASHGLSRPRLHPHLRPYPPSHFPSCAQRLPHPCLPSLPSYYPLHPPPFPLYPKYGPRSAPPPPIAKAVEHKPLDIRRRASPRLSGDAANTGRRSKTRLRCVFFFSVLEFLTEVPTIKGDSCYLIMFFPLTVSVLNNPKCKQRGTYS